VKKILALLFLVFLFFLLLIFYFIKPENIKPEKTGEFTKPLENKLEKTSKWHLIGKISVENGKVTNTTYFQDSSD
jgi:hypothetical protein